MQKTEPSNTNPTLKEQKDHGTFSFPCGLYETYDDKNWNGVKHHWHDELEILYFMEGEFELVINMNIYTITDECFYFVNSGELHSILAKNFCKRISCRFSSENLKF